MKYVVKKLKRSDLTFFEYQYRKQNVGNQKSLNLTRRVFIDILFPTAPGVAASNGIPGIPAPFHLPVTIYGPGERRNPQVVPRSVLPKTEKQKNWRLNGEFVRDPDDDPTRYHQLEADDVAILAFDGEAYPTALTMILLSQSEVGDLKLRDDALAAINNKAMGVITRERLAEVVEGAASPSHPIRELLDQDLDEALEDAALGSSSAIRKLRSSGSARRMSARALHEARRNAEIVGHEGEVLLRDWFQGEVEAGRLKSMEWVAETNAISPWDFVIEDATGTRIRVELKSTRGPFSRNFHISQAEVEWAATEAAPRTDLYRLFELKDTGASLRVFQDIRGFARKVIDATSGLGGGILPDGYTVDPTQTGPWSEITALDVPDEADEE